MNAIAQAPTTDRRKFIGGSDIAAILGLSPWKTPLQLWQDKTMPAMPENNDPARLKVLNRGKRMEPYILDMARTEFGMDVIAVNERYQDAAVPYFACEIDAEAMDMVRGHINLELKTVHPFKARDWGDENTDSLPIYYVAQVQWGMGITGRPETDVLALIGDDLRRYVVQRDDETIQALRDRAQSFWVQHVETLNPPAAASMSDVHNLFPRDTGASVEADTEAAMAVRELRALKDEAAAIEARIEGVEKSIKEAMGGAALLTLGGSKLATWKTQRTKRFDQRAFQAAHPALFDQFIKTTESRVFRLA